MKTKAKTKKIAAKRFRVTKNGKVVRGKQNVRHLRANKSKRQVRRLKTKALVSDSFATMIRRLLPYA